MFASTRPPPPSGRPPPYAFVNRMTSRNLRPAVLLFGTLACIWALLWASSAFRDIPYHQRVLPGYVTFDIVLGSLYAAVAVIEIYGIFAAYRAQLALVRIYAFLSLGTALIVTAIELMHLVLHFTFKSQLIDGCVKEYAGQNVTVSTGGFNPTRITRPITPDEARDDCNYAWSNGTFQDIAWLLVAVILGFLFASVTFAYYRQLMDPSLMRSQAPSAAYQMNPTRQPYGYNSNNIPGYNAYPSQSYGDYVPPYDGNKPPGYTSGGVYGANFEQDNEKAGYAVGGAAGPSMPGGGGNTNPFSDPAPSYGYAPPAGAAPPGLEPYAQNFNHDRSKDEGFDAATLEAAIKKSKVETKGSGRNGEGGAGPSSK